MTSEENKVRQMPKGGRKGGAVFPRIALSDAITYARKLVVKTHSSAQPRDVIYSGVVGAKSGIGSVRISALKQYGFLKGDEKVNYLADTLAKQITSAPEEELVELHRQAALKPVVFKKVFDTFSGDMVTKAKLRQRAADLAVHPDETETCIDLYISTMLTAALVSLDGDRVSHLAPNNLLSVNNAPESNEEDATIVEENIASDENQSTSSDDQESSKALSLTQLAGGPKAVFNVNVTLDSSLDIEKLQKQLELLKRFGAI